MELIRSLRTEKKRSTGEKVRVWCLLVALICLWQPVCGKAKVKAPKMDCHAYVVMDAGSGEVLFGQKKNKVIYPASTAKLMTAIVCVENGDVNSKIKTKPEVIRGTTYGTYCLGLRSGVTFTFKDLLNMSLVSSAADATDSLAVGVFGSKQACVDAMNEKCAQLGLTSTRFDNPVGSDIGAGFTETYATAAEMAAICRYAMTVPEIRKSVARPHYSTVMGQDITCNTTNRFLRGMSYYDKKKYKIIGSKSGTTNAAGHVFIATAIDKEGHEVICAYFGKVSKESTFSSIRKLLDYTFDNYKKGNLTLTKSNYDVRCSEEMGAVYDTYASLHCYPGEKDGRYHKNKPVKRKELSGMMRAMNNLEGDAVLETFTKGNPRGTVTAARLAMLVQEMYPAHLSGEEREEILKGCFNMEGMTEEEKEAYALFLKNGLATDESFRNARQRITRGQALLFADRLSDYQFVYAASHPVALLGSVQEASIYPQIPCGDIGACWNKKWTERLTEQAALRTAGRGE
ncbi:MAG: serine hydrolase [Eubacteriales bacterium]|nr:serine hydrolase [Eubacteriales bacterium]